MAVSKEDLVLFREDIGEMYERVQDLGSRRRLSGCELEKQRRLIWDIEHRFHPNANGIIMLNEQSPRILILPKALVSIYSSDSDKYVDEVVKSRMELGDEIAWIEDGSFDIYSEVCGGRKLGQRRCAQWGSRVATLYAEKFEQYIGC